MKRTTSLFLMFCMLLPVSAINTAMAASEAGRESLPALSLYPVYLQTPLGMPVLLDAETYPSGTELFWMSMDPSVATVDGEGCVTPMSPGETMIICSTADEPYAMATCGVLVVAEGKILLWEYPPEPDDEDEIIAFEKERQRAEDEARAEAGVEWPDNWPDDLPKINGKVTSAGGDFTEPTGLYVVLTIQEADIVKAYVDQLVSLGLKGKPTDYDGGFFVQLSGKGSQEIMVTYTVSEQQCFVSVKK